MHDLPINKRLIIQATPSAAFKLIFVMIALGGVDLGSQQLAKNSGLSLPTVQKSLAHLADLGMATQTKRYNGWALTTGVQDLLPGSQKVFDSLINIDSDSILNDTIIESKLINIPSPKVLDSPPSLIQDVPDHKVGTLARLHLLGVIEPKASKLATMDHVTDPYLEAYELAVNYGIMDLALAIYKIERGQNWAFRFPDSCPGCGHHYDQGTSLKTLDHGPDCQVYESYAKRYKIRKDQNDKE
jgi:hypothetical protein